MDEIINSVSTYVDMVDKMQKDMIKQEESSFINNFLLFRGQGKDYLLVPSIARDGSNNHFICKEKTIIDSMQRLKPNIFKKEYSAIDTLALLQHYGIPTRLLDVTENALVALYFACEDENTKNDGIVYVFKDNEFSLENSQIIERLTESYTIPYVERNINSFLRCDSIETESLKNLYSNYIIVKSSINSQRQYNQVGCFILFPNTILENNAFGIQIDVTPRKIYKKIIVDKNSKKSILETLSLLGITKSFIYPDRIDYVGKDMLKKIDLKNIKPIN